MSEEPPASGRRKPKRRRRLTRRLSFTSRVRRGFRHSLDRLLGTDPLWSLIGVTVIVGLLGAQRCDSNYATLPPGTQAPRTLRAETDVNILDVVRTEELRRTAREQVPQVYVHDRDRGTRLATQVSDLFAYGRETISTVEMEGGENPGAETRTLLADRFDAEVLEVLLTQRFNPALELQVKSALSQVMDGLIIANKRVLQREPIVTLIHLPDETEEPLEDYERVEDLAGATRRLHETLRLNLPRDQERVLKAFAASFLDANMSADAEATQSKRDQAAREVAPLLTEVREGQILVRKGEMITQEHLRMIRDVRQSTRKTGTLQYLLGVLLIASMTAFFLFRYTRYHQRNFRKIRHLHALLVLVLISMLGLTQLVLALARRLTDSMQPPFSLMDAYAYSIPLAAGSILLTLLANGRIAMVYAAFSSMLFGAQCGWDPYLMVWGLLVQCAGVYAITSDRERSALLRAGTLVGGAGAITALAMETIKGELEPLQNSLYGAGLALLGGALAVGLLVSFGLPLLEQLFNVLTDIRLLELSNSNHPLLAQLAVKAPGTYNHSLVVGTLAEEAAKAIGANALFCKVSAAYHDVGKMGKPEYFVENQQHGNPHDKLSPSMSALIIASHVKDGIKMAREAGLPEQIVDIIPQHHGTRLMTFFWEKAKQQHDPSMAALKEDDFRYPGPKPQSREAAIFMICDGVEAAARTIEEPTANRLQDMIVRVTNAIVLDRQLDECDLTFADLSRVQEALLTRLVSMYHHRVEYPGFNFSGDPEEAESTVGEGAGEPPVVAGEEPEVASGS